jgi:hypothetical protein
MTGIRDQLLEMLKAVALEGDQSLAEAEGDDRSVLSLWAAFSDHFVLAVHDKSSENLYSKTMTSES